MSITNINDELLVAQREITRLNQKIAAYDARMANDKATIETLTRILDEWLAKTEWVQDTATYSETGAHRADILKMRIAADEVLLRRCYAVIDAGYGELSAKLSARLINV